MITGFDIRAVVPSFGNIPAVLAGPAILAPCRVVSPSQLRDSPDRLVGPRLALRPLRCQTACSVVSDGTPMTTPPHRRRRPTRDLVWPPPPACLPLCPKKTTAETSRPRTPPRLLSTESSPKSTGTAAGTPGRTRTATGGRAASCLWAPTVFKDYGDPSLCALTDHTPAHHRTATALANLHISPTFPSRQTRSHHTNNPNRARNPLYRPFRLPNRPNLPRISRSLVPLSTTLRPFLPSPDLICTRRARFPCLRVRHQVYGAMPPTGQV
jgi:hypothetical protein